MLLTKKIARIYNSDRTILSKIDRCLLLFTRCSLLFAHCSLFSAPCLLIFARCSIVFCQYYCEPPNNCLTTKKFRHRYILANIWDFGKFFWMVIFQVFSTCKTIFKFDVIAISGLVLIYFYVLEVRSSHPEKFCKKDVLKNSTNSHENFYAGVSLAIRLQAGHLQLHYITESGTDAFMWILWNLYKNIYFINVCEGMPLKSRIFSGVSIR